MLKKSELEGEICTTFGYGFPKEVVPRYEVDEAHKTLGCWVSPSLDQTKQKEEVIKKCEQWVQRVAASHLKAHEKLLAYDTVLLQQIEYRLAASCFSKKRLQGNYEILHDSIMPWIPHSSTFQ